MSRFDYMAVTVREDPLVLIDTLAAGLDAEVSRARGMNGYDHTYRLQRAGETVGRVLAGGRNGNPNAFASGAHTDAFVPIVRAAYAGEHYVTRMDAAEDMCAPGLFDKLVGMGKDLAERKGLRIRTDGDWLRGVDGRTLYLGSPSSSVRVRIYEKGKQLLPEQLSAVGLAWSGVDAWHELLATGYELAGAADTNWVRAEVQVRPTKEGRDVAAGLSADEAWGTSQWTRELAHEAIGMDVPYQAQEVWTPKDAERVMAAMVKQYGPKSAVMAQELGGWAAFGESFGRLVDAAAARKAARNG